MITEKRTELTTKAKSERKASLISAAMAIMAE